MKTVKVSHRIIETVFHNERLVMDAIKFAIDNEDNVVLGPDFDKDNLVFIWNMDLPNFQHTVQIANGLNETNPEIYLTVTETWPCKGTGAEATATHHIKKEMEKPLGQSMYTGEVPSTDVADVLTDLVVTYLNVTLTKVNAVKRDRHMDALNMGTYAIKD